MEFERYYLDLFEMLNSACKRIAAGQYEKSDADRLFEFAKKERYPSLLAELAESFVNIAQDLPQTFKVFSKLADAEEWVKE